MDKLVMLNRLCAIDGRVHLEKPFKVVVDGRPWSVATNGSLMLGFAGAIEGIEAAEKGLAASVAGFLSSALKARTDCNLASLRAFAGDPVYRQENTCTTCRGTGKLCTCGECVCEDCDQGKVTILPAHREVFVLDRLCDAALVGQLFGGIKDEKCRVILGDDALSPIGFAGDGWAAVLMPMRCDGSDKERLYPRWNG